MLSKSLFENRGDVQAFVHFQLNKPLPAKGSPEYVRLDSSNGTDFRSTDFVAL